MIVLLLTAFKIVKMLERLFLNLPVSRLGKMTAPSFFSEDALPKALQKLSANSYHKKYRLSKRIYCFKYGGK
jgi:hypothetical protein